MQTCQSMQCSSALISFFILPPLSKYKRVQHHKWLQRATVWTAFIPVLTIYCVQPFSHTFALRHVSATLYKVSGIDHTLKHTHSMYTKPQPLTHFTSVLIMNADVIDFLSSHFFCGSRQEEEKVLTAYALTRMYACEMSVCVYVCLVCTNGMCQ